MFSGCERSASGENSLRPYHHQYALYLSLYLSVYDSHSRNALDKRGSPPPTRPPLQQTHGEQGRIFFLAV